MICAVEALAIVPGCGQVQVHRTISAEVCLVPRPTTGTPVPGALAHRLPSRPGLSGSVGKAAQTTARITAGSPVIEVTDAGDFQVGQGVMA